MKTFTMFERENAGKFLNYCDAGIVDDEECLDVLVYETEEDMENDTDNTLAIARETVIDDRYSCHGCGEYVFQSEGKWSNGDFYCNGCSGTGDENE